jgi:hypothetical protein
MLRIVAILSDAILELGLNLPASRLALSVTIHHASAFKAEMAKRSN